MPRTRKEIKFSPADVARFWSKVDKDGPLPDQAKYKGLDQCWVWTACKTSHGYGAFWVGGKMLGAHCAAWMVENGPIPDGLEVNHKCDRRHCMRPSHLHLGTTQSNAAERVERGRSACGDRSGSRLHPESRPRGDNHPSRLRPERLARGDKHWSRKRPELVPRGDRNGARLHPERMARGEAHGMSKLTATKVIEIRALYAAGGITKTDIAARFGVHRSLIYLIIIRKKWKHV